MPDDEMAFVQVNKMLISFTIPGAAVGKQRIKFAKRGKIAVAYTPEKTVSYENLIKLAACRSMIGLEAIKTAVEATIDIKVIPLASWSEKKRKKALLGDFRPTTKPDIDNIAKSILDACNKIVYHDDKQVVKLTITKMYASNAYVDVTFKAIL